MGLSDDSNHKSPPGSRASVSKHRYRKMARGGSPIFWLVTLAVLAALFAAFSVIRQTDSSSLKVDSETPVPILPSPPQTTAE